MPRDTFFNLPETKRQAIIDLAIRMFAENDYRNVSISEFVRLAGIAKGSFYQYFEDKKDLYLFLIEIAGREKQAFFARHVPPDQEGVDVFSYMRWLYTIGVKFEFQNPLLSQVGYRAVYGDAPLPSETVRVLQDSTARFFEELVLRGKQQGRIRKDLDPDLAAFIFNTIFTNLGDYMLRRLDIAPAALVDDLQSFETPDGEDLFNSVVDILEKGMGVEIRPD